MTGPVDLPTEDAMMDTARHDMARALRIAAADFNASLPCSSATFVLLAASHLISELSQVDPRAAAQYYRALADIVDPDTSANRTRAAEQRRLEAWAALIDEAQP